MLLRQVATLVLSDARLLPRHMQARSVTAQLTAWAPVLKHGIAQRGSCATRRGRPVRVEAGALLGAVGEVGVVGVVVVVVVAGGVWARAGTASAATRTKNRCIVRADAFDDLPKI